MSGQCPNQYTGGGLPPDSNRFLAELAVLQRYREQMAQQQQVEQLQRYTPNQPAQAHTKPCHTTSSADRPLPNHMYDPKPLLQSMADFPASKRETLVCVVASLKRPSLSKPWGISFSMFEDRIIIGHVRDNIKNIISWSQVVLAKDKILSPNKIFQPVTVTGEVTEIYAKYLNQYVKTVASSSEKCKIHNQLLPGDLILAIDGHTPSSFESLTKLTKYLRNALNFSLVVLRQPEVTTAAMAIAVWDPKLVSVPPPADAPYRAAAAADHLWQRILDLMSNTVLLGTPAPSTLIRHVTPEATPEANSSASSRSVVNFLSSSQQRALTYPTGSYSYPRGVPTQQPSSTTPKFLNPLDLLSQVAIASSASTQLFDRAKLFSTTSSNNFGHNLTFSKAPPSSARKPKIAVAKAPPPLPAAWRNPWFEKDGKGIPFDDNWDFSPEDGTRSKLFLPPIDDFPSWLGRRKEGWRSQYKVYKFVSENGHLSLLKPKKAAKRTPPLTEAWRNPWFKKDGEGILFDDNWEFSPEDGSRGKLFLPPIDDFPSWLGRRKEGWRSQYKVLKHVSENGHLSLSKPKNAAKQTPQPTEAWRNPWFKKDGEGIPFDDNWEFSPEDGSRATLFLPPIDDFSSWLGRRKEGWRSQYKVYKFVSENDDDWQSEICNISPDFWTHQGFSAFEDWMSQSQAKWKQSYRWNRQKRQRIQQECEEVVHVSQNSMSEFGHWLRIRKNQWKVQRRKRQRQKQEQETEVETKTTSGPESPRQAEAVSPGGAPELIASDDVSSRKRRKYASTASNEIDCIDEILEEEERQRKALEDRPPIDISFLFDATKGAPDDVVVHCLQFLERREHSKLLCINRETSKALEARDHVWRQLCPSHWVLPRRPRKPWHELYFYKLRIEQRDCQKLWDDLLLKCSVVLTKGDQMQKFEKLVLKGESDFGFTVNYVSPVVCERNSLLNLAVVNQRHKIGRWLVDQKGADIESYDRGQFTPLLNAAWAGDRQLVRFFLQRGADRSKIGFFHSYKALSHPDFKGLTAEGWARKKGHDEIAKLIKLGL
jgi:hypothetical protein